MKEKFEALVDHLMSSGFFLEEAVELVEKAMIQRALERSNGVRSAAAKILGIGERTLYRKIKDYDL